MEPSSPTTPLPGSGTGGNLWFTLGNGKALGQITTGGTPTLYSTSGTVTGITMESDGNMWVAQTDAGAIASITGGGTITQYPPSRRR